MIKNLLQETRSAFKLGTPITHKNLCVFPIFNGTDSEPSYMGMKTALSKGFLEIAEVSEGGSVPTLKAINKSNLPIILLDGEEVEGAKQNRVMNTTILLMPNKETLIPVSCTESGRWAYGRINKQFQDSSNMMSFGGRSRKSSRVKQSLKEKSMFDAQQSIVWQDIEALHVSSGSSSFSSTRAMKDAYEYRKPDIEGYAKAFPYQAGQKGLIVFKNGQLAGMDFVSRSDSYSDVHDKLIKSHIIDTLHTENVSVNTTGLQMEAIQLLNQLPDMTSEGFDSVGLGMDYRLENTDSESAVLVYQDTIIHWSAYQKNSLQSKRRPARPQRATNQSTTNTSESEQTTTASTTNESATDLSSTLGNKKTTNVLGKIKETLRKWSGTE